MRGREKRLIVVIAHPLAHTHACVTMRGRGWGNNSKKILSFIKSLPPLTLRVLITLDF